MTLQRTARFLFGISTAHASFTLVSLGLAVYTSRTDGEKRLPLDDNDIKNQKEVFDAKHYDLVTELVTKMYAGRGVQHEHCHLAESVSFEDAVAVCKGPVEVQETFLALKLLEPQSLTFPICVNVKPLGSSIALTYLLNQRYTFLSTIIDLQSLLVVEVELKQMKDLPESEFLIKRFEEQWNGIATQKSILFWIPRRINGILGLNITKRLLFVPRNKES